MVILPTAKGICGYYEMNTKSEVKRRLRESNNKVDSFPPPASTLLAILLQLTGKTLGGAKGY